MTTLDAVDPRASAALDPAAGNASKRCVRKSLATRCRSES